MINDLGGFNKIVFAVNLVFAILLFGSYLSLYISPSTFYPFAFLGLGYPILVFFNIVFAIYWTVFFKRQVLLSTIAILVGIMLFPRCFQFNFTAEKMTAKTKGDSLIKVMSYNVRLFDLYNWTNNKNTRNKLFKFINNEQVDVINLQEFYSDDENSFVNLDSIKKRLDYNYSNVHYTTTLRKTDHWGIATLSKYPIISKGFIKFATKGNNSCIYSDIVKGSDTIRFYNLHLQSIHFKNEDYKFLDSLNNNKEVDELKGARKILGKLKRAFVKRSSQVELVINHINKSPYDVVVCGDFNDTPVSYTYQMFVSHLVDAFVISGSGIGSSNNEIIPQRIDYIFHSPNIKSYSFKTTKSDLSDHYPLTAYIKAN